MARTGIGPNACFPISSAPRASMTSLGDYIGAGRTAGSATATASGRDHSGRTTAAKAQYSPAHASSFNPMDGTLYGDGGGNIGVGCTPGEAQRRGAQTGRVGLDQNDGNSILGRPSTKLHAPPGGNSAFGAGVAFGAADVPRAAAPPMPPQQQTFGARTRSASGSNAFASGASQNVGNFMTDRPTSRVLAPPGGGSTLRLG